MVSGNKKSKSKPTATPTKTPAQTTAHRQPLPSDENLEITEPAIYHAIARASSNKPRRTSEKTK